MMDILIKNATVITMDHERRVLYHGAVAIKGNTIADVGPTAELCAKYPHAAETVDASGQIVLPGLINCHAHAGHCIIGKLNSDMMDKWWEALIRVYENHAGPDFWYADARLHASATVRNGITTSVNVMGSTPMGDDPTLPQAHAKGFAQVGSREILGVGIPLAPQYPKAYTRLRNGVPTPVLADYDDMLAGTEETLKTVHGAYGGLTRVFVTPHQNLMGHEPGEHVPRRLMELTPLELDINAKVRGLAAKYNTQIYCDTYGGWITLAATDKENALLGPDVLIGMEHVAAPNYRELMILAETGTKVYYTAEGFYKRVQISELMSMGVPVGITTNGCAPRTTLDLLESLRRAILAERLFHDDYAYMHARRALECVTVDAARCIGDESLGSIAVGKKADISILDCSSPDMLCISDPIERVVYGAAGGDFDTVIVDGKFVMRARKLVNVDEKDILAGANEAHERAIRQCGIEDCIDPPIWGRTRMELM